jgi:formylglycine-generating enzyme required for sulfatase activity
MKTAKLLIILCVFLATFLVGGIALANDSGIFGAVTPSATLEAPKLTIKIEGIKVTLSWNKVTGATDYEVHYAQYPYDNPDTIKTFDVGDKTSTAYVLSPGGAYHVAVKACADASGFNCSNYSHIHDVIIPILHTFKNSLGQEFMLLPAGTFTMGSPSGELGRESNETQHQVTLTKAFYMQTTEVTQEQWKAVMGSNPSAHKGCPTCPVEYVSWNHVQLFITLMNHMGVGTYSLPTEAQWEYAARAGSTTAFYNGHITNPMGDDPTLDVIGWYHYKPYQQGDTHQVAQKTPNVWGLYDMPGNVFEWCQDWYGEYPDSAVTDPMGPSSPSIYGRVQRGGAWNEPPKGCRSAQRGHRTPGDYGSSTGFRLVRQP